MTKRYYFGSAVTGNWKVGGSYRYPRPDGGNYIEGKVLEIDAPKRLVTTFTPLWEGAEDAGTTQVTWLVGATDEGELSKVTLFHEGIDTSQGVGADIANGWARILSGLKTLLETGRPLSGQA